MPTQKSSQPEESFWATPSLDEIIAQQGTKPVENLATLQGDFWPENESVEDFLAFLDESRGRKRRTPAA